MSEEISVGDFVKVRSHGERFWCEVTGKDDEGIQGKVNNNLIIAPYKLGDTIGILPEEIIEVLKPEPAK